MVEKHLLCQGRALAQREQLQHLIFLAGQMHARARHLDGFLIEIDDEIAGRDDRLGVAFRAPYDGLNARDKLVLVERLGQIVIRAKPQTLDLVFDRGEPRKNEDRRLDLGDAQGAQDLIARHIREVQIEQDDIVVVKLAKIDAFFAEIRRIDIKVLGFEHELDALRRRAVVFNQ
ncbi:MAG: hypothetical protein USCAAHI_02334 [Beijerinckiaceae bacterium]|nr:MAG: hypothetical protein USCAAHI_02334 [Beijerinckiaceae bacterium]